MKFSSRKRHKMTAQEMEARRFKAMNLIFCDGHSQSEVARKLNVSRAAVCKWVKKYLDDDGLKRVQRSVNSNVLLFFLEPLIQRLNDGAAKSGYPDDKWTTKRLMALLRRMTCVHQDRTSVKRHLNRIGWKFDPVEDCWKVDSKEHAKALASFKGRLQPPKSAMILPMFDSGW